MNDPRQSAFCPRVVMGKRQRQRRRAAGDRASGESATSAVVASEDERRAHSYAKLLNFLGTSRSASAAIEEDDDDDQAGPARPSGDGDAGSPAADAEAEDGEEEEEEGDDDAADADDGEDDRPWRSEAYDAHFGAEWPSADLNAERARCTEVKWQLEGLGAARALVAPRAAPPSYKARRPAEQTLKQFGVLPALRVTWRAAYGDGPLSAAQASLLGVLSGYVDVLAPGTAPDAYQELLPILALHAAQHMVVSFKMLQRHQKKGLTPQDQGFTRPSILVLLPFRSVALTFVQILLSLLPPCYEQVRSAL